MEKRIRKQFTKELENIKKRILALGAMAEERVQMAIKAIDTNDSDLAQKIIKTDYEIDEIEVEIEEECLKVLALHQPVAIDLRFIVAVIKINAELERIGDYSEGIGRLAIKLSDRPLLKPLIDIPRMAEGSRQMLTSALEAFARVIHHPGPEPATKGVALPWLRTRYSGLRNARLRRPSRSRRWSNRAPGARARRDRDFRARTPAGRTHDDRQRVHPSPGHRGAPPPHARDGL